MPDPTSQVEIALRIPGNWSGPQELLARFPNEYRLTPDALTLPDGTEIAFQAVQADGQFPEIFRTSCRRPPTDDERRAVDAYTVNILLAGPGGSFDAARTMMLAAAAFLRAGAAGVFIDNCMVAHGAGHWLEMLDDGTPDALSFAFVGILRGESDVHTLGMHALGLRDIRMKRDDIERHGFDIVEVIRYVAAGEKPIDDGHILADQDGPRFQAHAQPAPRTYAGSPMYNPFGELKLVSLRDIAEAN
ncbi:MAG: hypothetical protein QM811_30390 [Pirellulales bacterium]